jgi:hypothetical protein
MPAPLPASPRGPGDLIVWIVVAALWFMAAGGNRHASTTTPDDACVREHIERMERQEHKP